ncbi:hypothetical protein VKT23_006881 [Stygiomarasmius scandens]|uniref:Methyltransferase domain-containing protein n=1 Tax=Marasmiellus scandens TaxID=2682957 RepID=A0ABR1JL54_9AGAR
MSPAQKDVEALLLRERNFKRRPGEISYPFNKHPFEDLPFDYPSDIQDYDNWDHLFFKACYKGITMHQFETPPSMVLDLGCGTGVWALDAAQQWPSSIIVGFDLVKRQPNLAKFEKLGMYKDLTKRLHWKQGNFLENLPFPSDHFDLVRVSRLGLAIPEDEWQFVLEEISRVMKSGAVLEIIEEDLIFPYCQSARPRPERPPLIVDFPIPDSISPGTLSSRSSLNTVSSATIWSGIDDHSDITLKKSGLSPLQESPQSIFAPSKFSPKSPLSIKSQSTFPSRGQTPTHLSFPTPAPQQPATPYISQSHPQDHSRLKAAWDAMLSSRFLPPRLITVLPFYLSSCFDNVVSHQSLQIPLPPNSPLSGHSSRKESSIDLDPAQQFGFQRTTETGARRSDSDEIKPQDLENNSRKRIQMWAPMHLARTVNTVQACKEAIYVEYDKLHSPGLPPVAVTVTSRPKDGRIMKSSTREAFEREWCNWENDMADRIGMRDHVMSQFQWSEPPGERPDWRVWRNNVQLLEDTQKNTGDWCRTIRGFVAWKP